MVRNESEKMSPKSETNVSDFWIQCILLCYLEVTLGNSVLDKHHSDRVITTHSGVHGTTKQGRQVIGGLYHRSL